MIEGMKITVSNKTLSHKLKKDEIGRFLGRKDTPNRIQFKTEDYSIDDFSTIVENGHTIAYQCFGDDAMNRKGMYVGTDFIVVDVDSTDLKINELLNQASHKPTIIHTTLGNLTEAKQYKYCYHLIYCLNETLYGEDNFNVAFAYFSDGYEELVDKNAKDCNRLIFTSNKCLPNYQYVNTGIIYNINNITNINSNIYTCPEKYFTNKSNLTLPTNLEVKSKNGQANKFDLDDNFITDLNTLKRSEFLKKYSLSYPITRESLVEYNSYGYVNLSGKDYYEVDNKLRWNKDKQKTEVVKVDVGDRNTKLFFDALNYYMCNPDITKEWLVYELVWEVYHFYDDFDGQLTNYMIINQAKYVWDNIDTLKTTPKKKKFKIDKAYWKRQNIKPQKAVGEVRKMIKDEEIGDYVDSSLSLEDNIKMMRDSGIKIKKQRLLQFCETYNYELKSNNEIRDNRIKELYLEDNTRTCRDIEKICKEEGIKVGKSVVSEIIQKIKSNIS